MLSSKILPSKKRIATPKCENGRVPSNRYLLHDGLDGLVAGGIPVEDPGPGVDPQVDEQGPGVLRQEDGRPADLRPAVLEVQDGAVGDAQGLQPLLILDKLALGLEPQLLAVDVAVLPLLLGDLPLDVADAAGFG